MVIFFQLSKQNLDGKLLRASEEILVRASANKKDWASLGVLNLLNSQVWSDLGAFFFPWVELHYNIVLVPAVHKVNQLCVIHLFSDSFPT